jgi:CheY-like chemotaxis protein
MEHPQILLIDDNPADTASALRGFSRDGRPSVHVIQDGSQAVDFLLSSQIPPKVVILDLDVQGGRGLETLGQLKGHPELRRIPVLACASTASPGLFDEALRLGANGCFVKPRAEEFNRAMKTITHYWLGLNESP